MKLAKHIAAAVILALAVLAGGTARAVVVVAGSGWQADIVDDFVVASQASPLMFTLGAGVYAFTLTDEFGAGDVYTVIVNGGTSYSSALPFLATNFDNSTGPEAPYATDSWLDPTLTRLQIKLGAGTYSLNVTGNCGGGCPSEFAYRLDQLEAAPGVPEPATWALLVTGMGAAGIAMRRRRQRHAVAR